MQDIGFGIAAKQFRQWDKDVTNALGQIWLQSRQALAFMSNPSEDEIDVANHKGTFDNRTDV